MLILSFYYLYERALECWKFEPVKLSYFLTKKANCLLLLPTIKFVKYQSSFKNDQVFRVRVFRVQVLVRFEKIDSQIIRVFSNISSFSNCDRVLADAYPQYPTSK